MNSETLTVELFSYRNITDWNLLVGIHIVLFIRIVLSALFFCWGWKKQLQGSCCTVHGFGEHPPNGALRSNCPAAASLHPPSYIRVKWVDNQITLR